MKSAVAAVAIGVLLGAGAVALGTRWVGASPADRVIAVTGESRLTGEPDTALVMFGVAKSAPTVAEGQKRVSQLVSKVVAALQAVGVKKEDIATSDLRISQGWDYRKNVPKGYSVSSTLTITVRSVQHVGRVVDTAVENGLNRLQGVSYDVRSPRWREKARREALADARAKAQAMASAAGQRLGRVVSVREAGEWQASPADEYYQARTRTFYAGEVATMPAAPSTRALPGQRALTVRVEVRYQLRPRRGSPTP